MRKQLQFYSIVIGVVILLMMFLGGLHIASDVAGSFAEKSVEEYAESYVANYEVFGGVVVPSEAEYRVTLIAIDGTVLFDSEISDVSGMENHADRPEVISALEGVSSEYERYSATLDTDMIYYALPATFGGETIVVRVAVPLSFVTSYIYSSMPVLLVVVLIIGLLSILLNFGLGKLQRRPLQLVKSGLEAVNAGEFVKIEYLKDDEDTNELLYEINEISEEFSKSLESARGEKAKLDYVLDNIADGIVAINARGQISAINKSARQIFEVGDKVVSKPISYLTSSERLLTKLGDNSDQIFEIEIAKKNYLCFLNFLPAGTEESFNRMLVVRDTTERKNAENMRSEFFANASHELKTPLTVVSGFLEILQMGELSSRQSEILGKIEVETARMKSLIEDMLSLFNIENAQKRGEDILSVSHVADEVFKTLSIESYQNNVKLEFVGSAKVVMSHSHLYGIIRNLVENGVRYAKAGSKNSFVKVSCEENNGYVKIMVEDNGIGIAPADQDRIFERFYRVEKSRSRKSGGTGLGLSIVKHSVELYGGTISIYSSKGKGTIVSLRLPKQ